jgi:hypothetical protein
MDAESLLAGLLSVMLAVSIPLATAGPARAAQGDCGQPISTGSAPSATDALAVLRAAVGTQACEPCICDVDRSGATSATDALAILRVAVGQAVTLRCVACPVEAIIGPAGGLVTSADGRLVLDVPVGALAGATKITIAGTALGDLPSQFEGISDAEAYTVGPPGQTFAMPVTARFDTGAAFVAPDGTLTATLTMPYSLEGDVVVPLTDVSLESDETTDTLVVHASVQHFSPLVYKHEAGATVTASGVPDTASTGEQHAVTAAVTSTLSVDSATYTDASTGAFAPLGAPPAQAPLDRIDTSDDFSTAFAYECTSAEAAAGYHGEVVVDYVNPNYTSSGGAFLPPSEPQAGQPADVAVTFSLSKQVDCIASPNSDRLLTLPGCTGPEAVNVGTFPVTGACAADASQTLVSFGCTEGTIAIDLPTGNVVYDRTRAGDVMAFGSIALIDPSGAEHHLVVQDGPQGYRTHAWLPASCALADSPTIDPGQSNDTDVIAYADDSTSGGALLTDNSLDRVIAFEYDQGTKAFTGPIERVASSALAGVTGAVVSAFSNGAGQPVVGITEIDPLHPSPGNLFFQDGSDPATAAVLAGQVGSAPRRIRCARNICAVSNAADATLTIATWNGTSAPSVVGTVDVGATPIGIDLLDLGGDVAIASTSFSGNTYTITEVDAAGAVVSNTTSAVLTGCTNPGHVAWVGTNAIVLSCKTSNNAALMTGVR